MIRLISVVVLLALCILCTFGEDVSIEDKVTSKMKHLMEEFAKDGNKHPLSDILVFVHSNYNAPLEQVRRYYNMMHGVFPRMIIFGEWDHETVHEYHSHGLPVFKCPHNNHGALAYVIMLKALEKFQHPFFKGYMYIHDDLLISPKALLNLDKSKVWIGNGMEKTLLEPWNSRNFRWVHFNQGGISSMQGIYDKHHDIEAVVNNCSDSRETGKPVIGTSHILYNGHSDFFYVPVSLLPSYKHFMNIFASFNLFLEIAIPMWVKCFTPNFDTQAIELPLCTTWDYAVRSDILKWGYDCRPDTLIIHPVKFSNAKALGFAQEFLIKHQTQFTNYTLH